MSCYASRLRSCLRALVRKMGPSRQCRRRGSSCRASRTSRPSRPSRRPQRRLADPTRRFLRQGTGLLGLGRLGLHMYAHQILPSGATPDPPSSSLLKGPYYMYPHERSKQTAGNAVGPPLRVVCLSSVSTRQIPASTPDFPRGTALVSQHSLASLPTYFSPMRA